MSFRDFSLVLIIFMFLTACMDKAEFGFLDDSLNGGSGSGPTWNPSMLQGLGTWLDATSPFYQDSNCTLEASVDADPVACWRGNSVNRFEFTTSGSTPVVETRDGRRGIYFSGNEGLQNFAAASLVNGADGFELFAVVQSDAINQNRCFFDVENTDSRDDVLSLRYDSSGLNGGCTQCLKIGITTGQGMTQTESASGIQSTDAQLLGASWSSGQSIETYYHGNRAVSHSQSPRGGSMIGALKMLIGGGSKANWQGLVFEIIYFERELTTEERQQVSQYLIQKWGL